jgi:hypothetical protein
MEDDSGPGKCDHKIQDGPREFQKDNPQQTDGVYIFVTDRI